MTDEPWSHLDEEAPYGDGRGQPVDSDQALEWARLAGARVGVARVDDLTDMHPMQVPVTQALRPGTAGEVRTMGKGITRQAAVIGALMEAVERASAELTAGEAAARHPADGLPRVPADLLHPLPNPKPLDSTVPYLAARGINSDDRRAVPLESVTLNWFLPLPEWTGRFRASSNGLAAGFTRTTAIVQGLCEVVERDAMALWDLRDLDGQAATRIDPQTVSDPVARSLLSAMVRGGLVVGLWDMTSHVGVPVVHAGTLARDRRRVEEGDVPAAGVGCHPDPVIALRRALCEAAQSRLSALHGMDEVPPSDYERALQLRQQALALLTRPPQVDFGSLPMLARSSPQADLGVVVEAVQTALGHEPLAVDLTREGLPPVVKVVVPGTESSMRLPGWTPGPRARQIIAERGIETPVSQSRPSSSSRARAPRDVGEAARMHGRPVVFTFADRVAAHAEVWDGIVVHPAARPGDLVAAVEAGATAIGLVDVDPHPRPRLRTSELLHVLREGLPLVGAVGLGGALCHDLQRWGARTVGTTVEARLTSDPVDLNGLYRLADGLDLVTLERATAVLLEQGLLDTDTADAFVLAVSALPWRARRWSMLQRALPSTLHDHLEQATSAAHHALHEQDLTPLARLLRNPGTQPARADAPPPPTTLWHTAMSWHRQHA